MIGFFEQSLRNSDDVNMPATQSLRGVEKYTVENKGFLAINLRSKISSWTKLRINKKIKLLHCINI